LGNVEIAEAVQAAQRARSGRVQISQDDVLRGLRREATLTGEGSTAFAKRQRGRIQGHGFTLVSDAEAFAAAAAALFVGVGEGEA